MEERQINGQKHKVYQEGSEVPFAYIPGGTKQICDSTNGKHVLVMLDREKVEDLRSFSEEQTGIIAELRTELKNIQDELVRKEEEIIRLNAQMNVLNGSKKK